MKKQHLFLAVMLMLTALTAIAQYPAFNPHAVKNIPFGEKLPPPDLTDYPDKFMPQMTYSGTNTAFIQGTSMPDANAIKKDPEYFRQLLLGRRKMQTSLFPNASADKKGENQGDSRSRFHLVKDINAISDGNPRNFTSHSIDIHYNIFNDSVSYAVLDSVIYFVADDGIHGSELWRSDGTNNGTHIVKDIQPGATSTLLFNITAVNKKIYFTAYNPGSGVEPWVSDGTDSGTHLLISGTAGEPEEFFAMGKQAYFIADGATTWSSIWKTDGTTAGTQQVIDIGAIGDGGEQILQPTVVNSILFFTFLNYDTFGWDLWRSDGTDSGTYVIKAFYPDYTYIPAQFTSYNNKLYFSADDGSGRKLWVSDGTTAGTRPVPGNDVLIDADYLGTSFPLHNHVLLIPGEETGKGYGLYKYDASDTAGLVRIKYFAPLGDTAFIVPSEMQMINKTLYFKVVNYHGGIHDELWSSKGTQTSTHLVQKFLPGETMQHLYNGSGICYFAKYDTLFGAELWRTAETSSGTSTVLVSDIFKGPTSSYPAYLTAFRGKLIFAAVDGKKGAELFLTGGDSSTTNLVKDINTVSTESADAAFESFTYGSYRENFNMGALGGEVFFKAYDRAYGNELYHSDGTAAGTVLLNDIIPGEKSYGGFRAFLSKNNAVYFVATNNFRLYSIYKTTGTKNSLQKMTPDYGYYIQSYAVADNGLLFYVVYNQKSGKYELWCANGTAAGTFLLSSTLNNYNYLNVIGNTALFVAGDSTNGYELWKSDGSVAGTRLVKDINPGISGSNPGGMFIYKNEAYFSAYDSTSSYPSFWKSNGTKDGTIKLKDIDAWWSTPTASASARFFSVSNNILYFAAVNHFNSEGTKLWKTDGTPAGTRPIKDIDLTNSDAVTPGPDLLTDVNGTIFFTGNDGVHGRELWKSDGHYAGTQLVKDVTPGAGGSQITYLRNFAGKLFFLNAGHLWTSDGTSAGTTAIEDSGIAGVYFYGILAAGNNLFMSGYTPVIGVELYVGKIDDQSGKLVIARATDEKVIKPTLPFDAVLYPNPALSNATLMIAGNAKNVYISITDMRGRRLWQTNSSNSMFVNLPLEKFAAGTYFVTVTGDTGNKTIKLVKQ